MTGFTTAAKVGLFTVVMAVAGVLIYRFVSKTGGTADGYTVYVLMKDATGVAKHSQVRTAGIPIGHISEIGLQDGQARIDIRVRPEIVLYDDASAGKNTTSLLGEYFIAIAQGTPGKRELKDGDQIKYVRDLATANDVIQDVSEIAKKVNRIATSLAESIGTKKGEQQLKDTLENLAGVTAALNETVRENRATVRNILVTVENITSNSQGDVKEILENMRVITDEVRSLVAGKEGQNEETGEKVRSIVAKVDNAASTMETTLKNLETVTGRLERGEGTLGRLSKDEHLINEIEETAEGINNIVGGISQLQTIVSLRTDYLFRAQSIKSFAELRLQPREDKYYSFEFVNDPRGNTRVEQIDVDTTNPNDPTHYREVRSITSNDFRFSLQFAQRYGPFVGRFGIKESTGGIGLDLLLLDDAFELRQDLFGFGEVVRPRWRAVIGYGFLNRLWLLGGVDDIITDTRRDYFVGLQLRFNDQDLKSLLPFAPSP